MIVRLVPNQVSSFWDLIKTGVIDIGARYFPGDWNLSNNIFQRCLAGLVQVWLCSEDGERPVFKGFILTEIITEALDSKRTLSVLSIYAFKEPSLELRKEGREVLERYAAACGCTAITLMTPAGHREKLITDTWPKHKKFTLFKIDVGGAS